MKQYEYNVITNETPLQEKILNRLGGEGWSLSSHTYSHFPNTPDRHVYTFKKEIVGNPKGIVERKFKLDDSFKEKMEEEQDIFWENPMLYAKLEHMIMEWLAKEDETVDTLVKKIMKLTE